MTAEIAIMNKEAVALAADSAVTIGDGETSEKIFISANKLFALSKYQPVGIMVYGNAAIMQVPWETVIKIYRKQRLGDKVYKTLQDYADDFINFLDGGNPLFPEVVQKQYLTYSVFAYFNFLKGLITEKIHSTIDCNGKIDYKQTVSLISELVNDQFETWDKTKNVPTISIDFNKAVLKKYGEVIDKAIFEIFEKLPLSPDSITKLKRIATNLFSKFPENIGSQDISGVVVAGFGKEDIFPSIRSFNIEGIVNNRLKFEVYDEGTGKIDFDDSNSSIFAFAQREMVNTFVEGIDPFYRAAEESYLSEIFSEYAEIVANKVIKSKTPTKETIKNELNEISKKILEEHAKRLEQYRRENYCDPILNVVSVLPKDELAAMAESLVSLTSFKRRVTMERETVAGPIDVAVITKGDGFVWIKRKHYFKPELNPQFFANYYRE